MAGAPFPYYVTFVEPNSAFSLDYAVNALAMPMIGGTTSWVGPVIGAVLLGTAQQLATVTISSEMNLFIVGVVLVAFVVLAPEGILGLVRRAAEAADRWPSALLEVDGLTKRFGGFTALNRVSLAREAGRALRPHRAERLGQDHAHQLHLGRRSRDGGRIVFDGRDITALPPTSARGSGIVAQLPDPQAVPQHDGAREPGHPARVRRAPDARRRRPTPRRWRSCARIGLEAKAHLRPAGLTQIEMRKLELARAMAARPKLLISDEAMAGLSQRRGGRHPRHPVPAERAGHHDHHDRAHHAGGDALLRAHRGPRRRRADRRGHAGRDRRATPRWRRPTLASRIVVRDVDAGYGAVRVLHGVSIEVRDGETVALLGTNGNGKSTLIKCIMGMVTARGGRDLPRDRRQRASTSRGKSTEEIVGLGIALVPEGRRLLPEAHGGGEPAPRRLPSGGARRHRDATSPSASRPSRCWPSAGASSRAA